MQEIERLHRDGNFSRDTLVGFESPGLADAFLRRRRKAEGELATGEVKSVTITEARRIGRNDPCPCGSHYKFKNCCGSRLDPNDPRIAD
jgi:hypothetical protein